MQEDILKRCNLCSPELKVSGDACLKRLNVICLRKDGPWNRVPVSRNLRDKRVDKCVCSNSI